jgi:hypothetical protein
LARVLMGFGVYGIIYRPVYEWIRQFRFIATDILAVLIRLGLDWAGTDILAGLGFCMGRCCLSSVLARVCVRVRVRVRAHVRARNYGFILVLCLAGILFFFLVLVFWLDLLRV